MTYFYWQEIIMNYLQKRSSDLVIGLELSFIVIWIVCIENPNILTSSGKHFFQQERMYAAQS